jgi:hypothetical protein
MNGEVPLEFARSMSTGRARIDPSAVFAPLQRVASASGCAHDAYWLACARMQFWSDLALAAAIGDAPFEQREAIARRQARLRDRVERAARARSGLEAADAPDADPIPETKTSLDVSTVEAAALIEKALFRPLPECCGYDLGDLEVCAEDARRFAREHAQSRPVMLVGIRSGGSVLAPIWHALLSARGDAETDWATVRPIDGACHPEETARILDWAKRRIAPVFVLLDDQPDTGATMACVAEALRPASGDLWYASVGRLWQDRSGRRAQLAAGSPLRDRPRPALWQLLRPGEQTRFLDTLSSLPGLPALPSGAEVRIHLSALEARYGRPAPWKPWQEMSAGADGRHLINPRKTPLIVTDASGTPRLQLRFVGEGAHGQAEHERVNALGGSPSGWFMDGYRILPQIDGLQPLREALAAADELRRASLLAACARWLRKLASEPLACETDARIARSVAAELADRLRRLNARFGLSLALSPALHDLDRARVPLWGSAGRAIRSSLRYSHAHWHWQLGADGTVHRFQAEANWGSISCLELEIASFAIEQKLAPAAVRLLAAQCDVPCEHVLAQLPAAALLTIAALAREIRVVDEQGLARMRTDVAATFDAVRHLIESR